MPRSIVHHDGWFFEWSTIVDAPVTIGMRRQEFKAYFLERFGQAAMLDLPRRLDRAVEFGTDLDTPTSARDLLAFNRAGRDETDLPFEDVIRLVCIEKRDPKENGK